MGFFVFCVYNAGDSNPKGHEREAGGTSDASRSEWAKRPERGRAGRQTCLTNGKVWAAKSLMAHQKPSPRQTRGCSLFGQSPCSSQTCRTRKRSATCAFRYLRFWLLKGPTSGMLNCSPNLSSSNWCLIYSAIRAVFFPAVST